MTQPLTVVLAIVVIAALYFWLRGAAASGGAETQLLKICRGDEGQASRLIDAEMSRAPGITRSEAAARAVQRYERDNR